MKKVLLGCLLVILMPLYSEAGLIRVDFDVNPGVEAAFGLGYMQFEDDIELGVPVPITSLTNLEWSIGVAWQDQLGDHLVSIFDSLDQSRVTWRGDIVIEKDPVDGLFQVSFVSSFEFYSFALDRANSIVLDRNHRVNASVYDAISDELYNYIGTYTTSVWFSDPPPVPVPSALILLASGLVGLAGISRRRK